METDSTVCKVIYLLMIVLVCSSCEFACNPEGTGEEGYNRTCVEPEPDSELNSFGCPRGRGGPTDYPYYTKPLRCDEHYDLTDQNTEVFGGTCCDWEVSYDGYEKWCLWVGVCAWEHMGNYRYKQSRFGQ
jgi:hypothetical protein